MIYVVYIFYILLNNICDFYTLIFELLNIGEGVKIEFLLAVLNDLGHFLL